jgi:DNA-binding transcriptional regulator GbsR (MarR family)
LTIKGSEKGLSKFFKREEVMLKKISNRIFGDRNEREMRRFQPVLEEILKIYPGLEKLSENDLKSRIQETKKKIQEELKPQEKELADIQEKYQLEPDENKKKFNRD